MRIEAQRAVEADASQSGTRAPSTRKYVPIRRIGIGGMAEVFLARQYGEGGFEKQVVLKRPLPEHTADRGLVARLLREARLVAKLDHPGIAAVYEVGRDDEGVFIAMEYVDGHDLRAIIRAAREHQRFPTLAEVLSIATDLSGALDHAHNKRDIDGTPLGIVHRDVSPSNIIVRTDGMVKLLDFGIAKDEIGPTLTGSSELVGKIVYMSPEQTMRWSLDARSDIFALGVVLWELLALRRPFPDADHVALLRHIPERDVPSILEVRSDLPAALDVALRRALARNRDERYADARQLRADLLAVAEGCGITPSHDAVAPLLRALFPGSDDAGTTELGRSLPPLSELAPTDTLADAQTRRSSSSTRARKRWTRTLASLAFVAVLGGGAFGLASRSPAAQDSDAAAPVVPESRAAAAPTPAAPARTPAPASTPSLAPAPAVDASPASAQEQSATPKPAPVASSRPRAKPTKSRTAKKPKRALDPVLPPGFR